RRRTLTRTFAARCDLRRVSAALPPDHDDDALRNVRRAAARARHGRRRRAAPPTRHLDRRRVVALPIADAVHDTGRLSLPRSIPLVVPAPFGSSRDATTAGAFHGARGLTIMRAQRNRLLAAFFVSATLCAGCTVGPDYVRPSAETPAAYKETPPA